MRKVGIEIAVAEAMIMPQSMPVCSTKLASPMGKVYMAVSVCSTKAKVKSFHDSAKAKVATEMIPGKAEGRQISKRVRRREAPKTQAASSRDTGTIWKYCHMIQMLSGRLADIWARMMPHCEFRRCSQLKMM